MLDSSRNGPQPVLPLQKQLNRHPSYCCCRWPELGAVLELRAGRSSDTASSSCARADHPAAPTQSDAYAGWGSLREMPPVAMKPWGGVCLSISVISTRVFQSLCQLSRLVY